jgi:hypothetical protein
MPAELAYRIRDGSSYWQRVAAGLAEGDMSSNIAPASLNSTVAMTNGNTRPNEGAPNDTCWDWNFGKYGYDPVRRRLLGIGAPAGLVPSGETVRVVTYNEMDDEWVSTENPFSDQIGHFYDTNAVDLTNRWHWKKTFNGGLFRWDLDSDTRLSGSISLPGTTSLVPGVEFWPDIGTKGSLFLLYSSVRRYDVDTSTWSLPINNTTPMGDYHCFGQLQPNADSGNGMIVYGGGNSSVKCYGLKSDLTAVEFDDMPASWVIDASNRPMAAIHPKRGSRKFVRYHNGTLYTLDTDTGAWDSGVTVPSPFGTANTTNEILMVALPHTGCLLFGKYLGSGASITHLYRPAS